MVESNQIGCLQLQQTRNKSSRVSFLSRTTPIKFKYKLRPVHSIRGPTEHLWYCFNPLGVEEGEDSLWMAANMNRSRIRLSMLVIVIFFSIFLHDTATMIHATSGIPQGGHSSSPPVKILKDTERHKLFRHARQYKLQSCSRK
ncbi:protein kinase protein with tetratricopeptiderepeat domain [Striga asiatica]|uniref:Protein kinase protein with tetratricopeptiderepeat domain n=1 Tax=Striga asiatica TaxID=4170 RepID=A0A5A7QRS1_STRAF|nr:protein kinase protein with tetratricopeptiderepeat domain [Striga asiatica]